MKKLGFWIYNAYNSIFNYNVNPLKNVKSVKKRLAATVMLATLWSIAFGYTLGSYYWFGSTLLGHMLVIWMVFFTVFTFHYAEKNNEVWFLKFKHRLWLSKVHKNITEKEDYKKFWGINRRKSDK